MDLAKKYEPKRLAEFVGNKNAVETVIKNLGKKPLLLFGPPGVGKSSLCRVIAKEFNYELYELNASDRRDMESLEKTVMLSASQQSLFGKKKLIVIDEVDGLSGKNDFGAISKLTELIKVCRYPLVFIAQDAYDPKLRALREKCLVIPFSKIPYTSILKRLKEICEREGLKYDERILKTIAQRSNGDLRAAIMDLESLIQGNSLLKTTESLGYRDVEKNVFDSLRILLKTKRVDVAKGILDSIDMLPQDFFWWVEENVIREYSNPKDRAKALEILSKADMVQRWITKRQAWNLLRFFSDLITVNIALAKEEKYGGFTKYAFPFFLRKMSIAKSARQKRDSVCETLGKEMHASKRIVKQLLPYLEFFIDLNNI